ncbi:MAG: hypothetical protein ACPHIC_03825 [Acidimicrobiales bacterium]
MNDSTDEVLLRLPARTHYGRIVRVGAAALGIRQGLSFAEIDDLRLAIDEAVILMLSAASADAEIRAVFRFDANQLELELACDGDTVPAEHSISRFEEVAGELVDEYTVDPGRAWVRMKKTPTTP